LTQKRKEQALTVPGIELLYGLQSNRHVKLPALQARGEKNYNVPLVIFIHTTVKIAQG